RRADVVALGPKGEIEIIEIKSSVSDFRADLKWQDYGPFCDRFFFAVSNAFPTELIPESCGLIIADGFGGAVVRLPETHRLSAARRKAVTLRFARLAALRAAACHGMVLESGPDPLHQP
ncbi:MAG: MmcB family DNA repair protein, partial [Pseudomonadota bacterium]